MIKHFCDHCGVELRGQWWTNVAHEDLCHDCHQIEQHQKMKAAGVSTPTIKAEAQS